MVANRSMYYVLDDAGNAVAEPDVLKWGAWYEARQPDGNWVVGLTHIGDSRVSTVFLSLDHAIRNEEPILWETLVFGGPLADEMDRYETRQQAVAGHAAMCERVRAATP